MVLKVLGIIGGFAAFISTIWLMDAKPLNEENYRVLKNFADKLLYGSLISIGGITLFLNVIIMYESPQLAYFALIAALIAYPVGFWGIYKWHKYNRLAEEIRQKQILQEAIAKGVEVGMKKAKET
ncbi:hypothetical protein VFC49_10645 [Thermococcus sp. SY098]|uniref:hypothetical protein n=1 Tax=Thermococcus sp. SY098 TaxID=3111325 RepID=UPI002D76E347|nr:hypothetical protein [Thermococcus sp. SY098]WRS52465.1 hypothetical protein VFC49_10645 [Thermococcus sp. SY098]